MPGYGLAVFWHLAEKVRAPADDVGTEYVLHISDDTRLVEQIPDATVLRVGGGDGVGVASFGEHACE